jgi:N-acetylmuramoyl-L-alanine amidase
MASTADQPLHRQLQLHPSLYCLMATDEQASIIIDLVADAIEHEGLSGTTVEWLRQQSSAARRQQIK